MHTKSRDDFKCINVRIAAIAAVDLHHAEVPTGFEFVILSGLNKRANSSSGRDSGESLAMVKTLQLDLGLGFPRERY